MSDTPEGAILQRDKETYAIVPRTPAGMLNAETLEAITNVIRKYNIPIVKITSGQRLALVGMKADVIPQIWEDLGTDIGRATELCVHYAQACPGTAVCRFGLQDSLGLGLELEKMFAGMELPAKLKFGVSGCPMCCGESYVRDVGLIGKKKGWTVIFGGNSGGRPRIGDVLAEHLSKEDAVDLVRRCLEYYKENGKKKERSAKFMARIGADAFKEALGLTE
ncbi:NAD(P)/FAD-dependent oxidoreductase [Desulfonema ishimotonii]|uniref:NAD(P)/FAD-dependent oxidoreductase n=1 Tax=Desulfonema ishimotonii TaxID=45657 RepID=A0A401FZI9_9BACT|nr:NAD(P)/FAD-dependent oxidoreductase [Desulfonema ishimotonii]GBC62384.1 NAD(P)/FAD-dependent oxidoreductase [Desulfonema ishimotonii]